MALIRRNENENGMDRTRGWDPFDVMQDIMRWDPFRELTHRAFGGGEMAFVPSFDVKETNESYVFKADLPGVAEDDLDISLTGNRLTVSGQREQEKKNEGDTYYSYERSYGGFSRSFTLPEGVDAENVSAELKNGVLTVVVPKKPEVQPKRILLGSGKREKDKAKA